MIVEFNRQILQGLEVEEGVVPGKIRQHDVGVASYRAPASEDCPYLLQRLCDWLYGPAFDYDRDLNRDHRLVTAALRAIVGHVYLAWIHPFGDGNGRTARLLEFYVPHAGRSRRRQNPRHL